MYNNLPNTLFVGKSVIYLPTCHSTNDIAVSFAGKSEIFEGTVVITSNQTAGKGQRGNSWESEPYKNLTLSLLLKPNFLKVNQQFLLNIVISLAVHDFLTRYLNEKVKIKWPNDIFFQDNSISKKLCGILIQNTLKKDSLENSVIGIGVNINQLSFGESRASSLASLTGKEYDLEALFRDLMKCIETRYLALKEGREDALKEEYLKALYWFGEERIFNSSEGRFSGIIRGIDEIGRLRITRGAELLHFSFKEVEFIE